MADIYVKSGAANSTPFASWANAASTLSGAAGVDAAGDTIWVSSTHSESSATAQTISLAGASTGPVRILSVVDSATPPTTLQNGASISTTGTASVVFVNGSVSGSIYANGLIINAGSGSSSGCHIMLNQGGGTAMYEDCAFRLVNTNVGSRIYAGNNATAANALTKLKNCSFQFASVSQTFDLFRSKLVIEGGRIEPGGSFITTFATASANVNGMGQLEVNNFDFSNCASTFQIANLSTGAAKVVVRNSRLPPSWTGNPGTVSNSNARIEMYNCDSGDTNYRVWIKDLFGEMTEETTVVRTGGATDGTTAIAWKLVSTSAAIFPFGFTTPEMVVWNSTTGASKTVTVEVLTDGVTLTDADIAVEVTYGGTNGYPLGVNVSDAKTNVLASATNQTSSTTAWTTTGIASPVKQKLSVTFTPQEAGYFIAKVVLTKPDTTVYVCPKLTVA